MNQPDLYSVLAGAVGTTVVLRGGVHVPVKIAAVHRAGSSIILAGSTLDGTRVTRTVAARGASPVVAGWAVRLGSMLRLAWNDAGGSPDWDTTVKDLITEAGLPVDQKMHWGTVLNNIFGTKENLGKGDSELRDELIQGALVNIVMNRRLEKFDPNAVKNQDQYYTNLPLEEKVSIWVVQLLKWYATSEGARHARIYKNPNVDSLDREATDQDGLGAGPAVTPVDPEIGQDSADDIRSLQQIRDAFSAYLQHAAKGGQMRRVMLLFDLLTREDSTQDAVESWKRATNTGYGMFHRTMQQLRTLLVEFANSGGMSRNLPLVRMVNDLRLKSQAPDAAPDGPQAEPLHPDPDLIPPEPAAVEPEPAQAGVGPKAQAMQASADVAVPIDGVKVASFMRRLQNDVVRLATESSVFSLKLAKPKVVGNSLLFVVLEGSPLNYLNMNIRFGGPSIQKNPQAGTEYTIDVGMYGPDRSLPEKKIKKQLNALVFPSMRADVPEAHHNLLEKVIRELRAIIWENAVEFFEVPQDQRSMWRHVIKMDVLTLQDVKVNIADQNGQTMSVTGATQETSTMPTSKQAALRRRAALNLSGTLKRIATENPEQVSTTVESIKQKLLDQVTLLENFQEQLDMTPEGSSKFEDSEADTATDIAPDEKAEDPSKDKGTSKDTKEDKEEDKEPKFAGLKRAAEQEPEEIEDAIQDFFLGLDEIMAETEGLADTLGVDLVAPEVGDGDGDADDLLGDGAVEIEEEEGSGPEVVEIVPEGETTEEFTLPE